MSRPNPPRRHTTTLVVTAPAHVPAYRAYFEPEGSERDMAPGDRLTITMTGSEPREIEIHPFAGGLVIWRPLDDGDIQVVDQHGQVVEDLWRG
jgi:hypothetical protein